MLSHKQGVQKVCPKTGKPIERKFQYRWLKWLFPLTGIGALIWFLIRVIPKPSRAEYPCQRVAFPVASSFIAYLLGLGAVTIAMKKAQQRLRQARYVLAAVCVIVAIGCTWLTISINSKNAKAGNFIPPDPPNSPMGVAKGIYPGRVAFVLDVNATDWDGVTGYYWEDTHTNQEVVDQLMDKVLRALTNEPTNEAAWDALFRYFNQTHGKGNVGYTPGEKIRIKPNSVNERRHTTANNQADNTPQVVLSLLRQLVYKAGVPQEDIIYGDTSRYIPDKVYNKCHAEFPDVVYEETNYYVYENDPPTYGTQGRVAAVNSDDFLVFYSDITDSNGLELDIKDKLPMSYVNASYVINLPVFKCHSGPGITLVGKNWYGSLGGRNPHDLLHNTTAEAPLAWTPAHYRAQVDLMGSKYLGGKTFLNLIDGIWGNRKKQINPPEKWSMAPFNTDYTSCLFASQDAVAIDSVGLDFLRTQWAWDWASAVDDTVDDYLHEAALANDPPSGTFYDPDHPLDSPDRVRLPSLGVHEHWDSNSTRQYTRNLGTGNGIELVTSATLSCSGDIEGDVNIDCEVNYEDLAVIRDNWLTPQTEARFGDLSGDGTVNFKDFALMAADWAKCNIQPSGNCNTP